MKKWIVSPAAALIITVAVTVAYQPSSAEACHWTNKWKIKKIVDRGWDDVVWVDLVTHEDYIEFGINVAVAIKTQNWGLVYSWVTQHLASRASKIANKFGSKGRAYLMRLLRDVIRGKSRRSFVKGGLQFEVGHKAFNRKECVKGCSADDPVGCVSMPNTHHMYIRWRRAKGSAENSKLYQIKPKHSLLCLDVVGNSKKNGKNIQQYTCHSGANQKWIVEERGRYFRIKSKRSGKCLDVPNGTKKPVKIQQYRCHSGNNQLWRLSKEKGGYYQIRNVASGLCLDVMGASGKKGARIQQYRCHRNSNQKFGFYD